MGHDPMSVSVRISRSRVHIEDRHGPGSSGHGRRRGQGGARSLAPRSL
jgi:hypothetical protein